MKNKLIECLENSSQKNDLLECRWLFFHLELALKYIVFSYSSNSHFQKQFLNNRLQMLKLHTEWICFFQFGSLEICNLLVLYSSDSQMR